MINYPKIRKWYWVKDSVPWIYMKKFLLDLKNYTWARLSYREELVLQQAMSLVDLLCDEEEVKSTTGSDFIVDGQHIIEIFSESDPQTKRRLLRYFELLEICEEINRENDSKKIKRNVSVIQDIDGNNIVMINDIVFKGKRSVEWAYAERYLRQYVGDFYQIAETEDMILSILVYTFFSRMFDLCCLL